MFLPLLVDAIAVIVAIVIALLLVKQNQRPLYAVLFFVVYLVARIVNQLPFLLGFFPQNLQFNWYGHFLMIAWVLIFVWLSPLQAKDIGLTLKQRPGTVLDAVLVSIGVVVFKGGVTALFGGGASDGIPTETLLFQITMPPLAQELLHSGLLLSLMILALGGPKEDQDFDWGQLCVLAVIVTALSHALKFGFSLDPGFQISFFAFLTPFIGKLVYGWLRLSTGSLLFPVLAYSVSNLVVLLVQYLL